MAGVAQARQHNLAALPDQLTAIRQWRDVWIAPCLSSLLKPDITFLCEISTRVWELGHRSTIKHKYEALKWPL